MTYCFTKREFLGETDDEEEKEPTEKPETPESYMVKVTQEEKTTFNKDIAPSSDDDCSEPELERLMDSDSVNDRWVE